MLPSPLLEGGSVPVILKEPRRPPSFQWCSRQDWHLHLVAGRGQQRALREVGGQRPRGDCTGRSWVPRGPQSSKNWEHTQLRKRGWRAKRVLTCTTGVCVCVFSLLSNSRSGLWTALPCSASAVPGPCLWGLI